MAEPLMLSVADAAALLGIAERTAYALIRRNEFPVPVRKVGGRLKVSRLQLERWAAGEHVPTGPSTGTLAVASGTAPPSATSGDVLTKT